MKKSTLFLIVLTFLCAFLLGMYANKITVQAKTVSTCRKAEKLIRKRYGKKWKVRFYNSTNLSTRKLKTRKGKGVVIVEKIRGTVTDNRSNGNTNGCYISYKSVKGVRKGSQVVTYLVYNPRTNYIDDIIRRYDVVIKR